MELWAYLRSLWRHWWALMSSAVFTILGIIVLALGKSKNWTLWATFGAASLMLLFASFLAWRDEHKENSASREPGSVSMLALETVFFTGTEKSTNGLIQIGVVLHNNRDRLIEYAVEKFDLTVETTASQDNYANRGGYVYASASSTFRSPKIALDNIYKVPISGRLEYIISYQVVGSKLKHQTSKILHFDVFPGQVRHVMIEEHES